MSATGGWRSWWQAQRGWLLGAVLLGAIVLGWPTFEVWRDYRATHTLDAIDVAASADVEFGGARWQLGDVEIIDPRGAHLAQALPANAAILIVHFSMTPTNGISDDERHQLAACEGRLGDRAGRHWEPQPLLRGALGVQDAVSCVAAFTDALKPQSAAPMSTWHFAHIYVVPDDVVATARPEITLSHALPRFLRFSRR